MPRRRARATSGSSRSQGTGEEGFHPDPSRAQLRSASGNCARSVVALQPLLRARAAEDRAGRRAAAGRILAIPDRRRRGVFGERSGHQAAGAAALGIVAVRAPWVAVGHARHRCERRRTARGRRGIADARRLGGPPGSVDARAVFVAIRDGARPPLAYQASPRDAGRAEGGAWRSSSGGRRWAGRAAASPGAGSTAATAAAPGARPCCTAIPRSRVRNTERGAAARQRAHGEDEREGRKSH
jgi:hypothetical protein